MCVLLTAIKKNLGEWMEGWVDGWMGGKAGLRIAYSNQKSARKNLELKPAVVAELVRALVYQLKGRGFESGRYLFSIKNRI